MAYGPTGGLGLRGWTSPAPHWIGMEMETTVQWKWQLSWECDNLIFISHASRSTVSFSVTSVTSHMKSLMSQDSGIHHLHFTASDIPLQAFSDFTKVSRSPIIRSIRLLAAHAMVVSRHLYIISWAHCGLRRLLLLPLPADSQWTQLCDFQNRNRNRKPVLALPKTEKPVLQNDPGFGNPTLGLLGLFNSNTFYFSPRNFSVSWRSQD